MERTQKLTPYGSGQGGGGGEKGSVLRGHGLLRAVCILPRKMPNENNKNWLSMKLRMVGESRERDRGKSGRGGKGGVKKDWQRVGRVSVCGLVCSCVRARAAAGSWAQNCCILCGCQRKIRERS